MVYLERLTQTRGGADHGVQTRSDAVCTWTTPVLKDDPVVMMIRHLLHRDAHDTAGDGAHRHTGDEQTRRDLRRITSRIVLGSIEITVIQQYAFI